MNRTEHKSSSSKQTAARGFLARKLLQVAKRRTPAASLLQHGDVQEAPSVNAKMLGPYCNRDKWRLIVKEGNQRKSLVYGNEQDALKVRDQILGVHTDRASRTIGQAVEEFLALKRKKGFRERTLQTVSYKLAFLPSDRLLSSVTFVQAESWYAEHAAKVAVATHHIGLWYAKALFKFCIKQKYLTVNPFSEVQAEGRPAVGKPQAQALGHGSDQVTRKHYIAPSALESARSARIAGVLLGEADLDNLISTLRTLPTEQLDLVCVAVGLRR